MPKATDRPARPKRAFRNRGEGLLVVEPWRMLPGMRGDPRLVRIGAGLVEEEGFSCPSFAAAKARPGISPRVRPSAPKAQLETFALGPVTSALDRIEFDQASVDAALAGGERGRRLHPGLARFAEHAVRTYVGAGRSFGGPDLIPVRDWWVAQKTNDQTWELYAWGRRYQSADGRLREFRFLRYSRAAEHARNPTQIAIAAYAAAFGSSADWPEDWEQPFQPRDPVSVDRVRIVDVALLDGSSVVLFDGSPDDVRAYFAKHGRTQIADIAAGGSARPGSSCAGCKQLTVCEEIQRIPGLLGLPSRRAPLRTVSVSELRYYRSCPARAHLSGLNLPRSNEYSTAAVLGHAVHGWLETMHGKSGQEACGAADGPADEEEWSAGRWRVTGQTARLGAQMIAHHREVCAFQHADLISDVRLEHRLAFHDTAANAIVLAKPDMLYVYDGSWVWRELKTTQKAAWFHNDLLDEFPQLALAVVLLAEGALGGDGAGSWVELEVLRPDGSDLFMIDPADRERVAKARAVLAQLAQPWREDEAFDARPGRDCRWCPVSMWCPSFLGSDADTDQGGS